jgi:transcriptional regulator with XRE-family HTH domain
MNISTVLDRELQLRCATRPNYSLRAFAQHLGISASSLSRILTGQRQPSPQMGSKIMMKLPANVARQISHIESKKKARPRWRSIPIKQLDTVLDWRTMTLYELIQCKGFISNAKWVAEKIGISTQEVLHSKSLLLEAGLIAVGKDKSWKSLIKQFVGGALPRTANRIAAEKQIHQVALAEMERLEKKGVHFTGNLFLSFDQSRMEEAKIALDRFIREFSEEFSEPNIAQIYAVNVSVFPLTS